jgi:hypothetical protein
MDAGNVRSEPKLVAKPAGSSQIFLCEVSYALTFGGRTHNCPILVG